MVIQLIYTGIISLTYYLVAFWFGLRFIRLLPSHHVFHYPLPLITILGWSFLSLLTLGWGILAGTGPSHYSVFIFILLIGPVLDRKALIRAFSDDGTTFDRYGVHHL